MAIVKCKPTSAGRRHVVKIVNPELYKGKPYAPLLDMVVLPLATSVVVINNITV